MKIYFAHAMTEYGHQWEAEALKALRADGRFTEVVNPSEPEHAQAAVAFKRAGKNPMDYFCALVRECDALAFMTTTDDKLGPGVSKEIVEALSFGKPVFECRFHGFPVTIRESGAAAFFQRDVLSIAEMRARIAEKANG